LGVEEYDRDGEGFDSAETAIVLGQLFELGGKRRWRARMAEAEGELAGWDYESKRLDVFTETARRFVALIAAQRRLGLASSAVELAEKTHQAVGERVKAGKEPPLQASKAAAELEMARMEGLEARNSLDVSRKKLAAMWGAERPHFQTVQGDLDTVLESIPAMEAMRSRLSMNPDLARWEAELRLRTAALSSERAARVPDLEASLGFLRYEEDGTDALAFGIGVPLLLFDRNQGSIAAAKHDLARVEAERRAAEAALAADLAEAHAHVTSAHSKALTLRARVVPAMQEASDAAHEGYRQGKFGFLDMLDAQRGLFEAKGALLDALSDYHAAAADLQRITGTSIEELRNLKQEK
jgi:cobalt-zinc-cadmium efflux system outer membrane protein